MQNYKKVPNILMLGKIFWHIYRIILQIHQNMQRVEFVENKYLQISLREKRILQWDYLLS